jgi:hypothetical protein
MKIIIPLPRSSSANTFKELKSYLKQLELAVHYAQKQVEHCEREKMPISEDGYVCFKHPLLEIDEIEGRKDFTSEYYEELQNIELEINI